MSKNTNLSFLTDYITADITNGRIGINNASPTVAFDVTGVAKFSSSVTASGGLRTTSANGYQDTDGTRTIGVFANVTGGLAGVTTISNHDLGLFTNNLERMRITSAGNVGIGNSYNLDAAYVSLTIGGSKPGIYVLKDASGADKGYLYINSSTSLFTIEAAGANPLLFSTNSSERMRILANGNVGIGTSTPTGKLQVSGGDRGTGIRVESTINAGIALYNSVGGREYQLFAADDGHFNIYENVGGATRFKLFNNGNIAIGTTSDNGEKLYVSGSIRATGTITANSDISLKKNLLKIENALEKVEQINGYTYEFKEDDSKRHAGLIAQEVEVVLPEIVNAGNDKIKGIEYGNISALLIEAIKELSKEINLLKNK